MDVINVIDLYTVNYTGCVHFVENSSKIISDNKWNVNFYKKNCLFEY